VIDYVMVDNKLFPYVQDTRVYRGYDIHSDHFLLVTKLRITGKHKESKKKEGR
jgi:hypothetical protein